MNSSKPDNSEQPAGEPGTGKPPIAKDGLPSAGNVSITSRQAPPVQSGSQYGGYGQGGAVFGRDSGSSSDEGGQGASQDLHPADASVHPTKPRGAGDSRDAPADPDSAGREQFSVRERSGGAKGPEPSQR